MLTEWLQAALSILFPQRCPVCRQWADNRGWCLQCLSATAQARQIALPLHKLAWLDEVLVVCEYTGAVQRLIRDMKFRRLTRQAAKLGQLLAHAVAPGRYRDIAMVVPVPLHADRRRERGFNQTALIFEPWAAKRGMVWQDVLARTRPTRPQWELTLTERRQNIKGAFVVTRPELITGKQILLVDDIFTSGVTMDECARVLKRAGASSVKGLALASGAR
jgi:ComF family protein